MDNTILIAKILGVYMLASGIVMLFRGKTLAVVLKDLFDHPAIMWVAGLVLIVLGGLLAFGEVGNKWTTIFGWVVLLKGVLYIVSPDFLLKMSKSMRPFTIIWGILAGVLGIWLLNI